MVVKSLFQEMYAARGRRISGVMLHRIIALLAGIAIIVTISVFDPKSTSDPAASPLDLSLIHI